MNSQMIYDRWYLLDPYVTICSHDLGSLERYYVWWWYQGH